MYMGALVQLGVGLLSNIFGGIQQRSAMEQFKTMQAQNSQMMSPQNFNQMAQTYEQPDTMPVLDFQAPSYPQKDVSGLQSMQLNQLAERENFSNSLKSELNEMTSDYFKDNHYETNDGKVVLDSEKKPLVKTGSETASDTTARLKYEQGIKNDLTSQYQDAKDKLLGAERQKILTYLNSNKDALNNPSTQSEIQKMIVDTQKKSIKLARENDKACLLAELPTQKMMDFADEKLNQLYDMQDRHIQEQKDSKEGKAVEKYQDELASAYAKKREEIKEISFEQELLQGRRYDKDIDLAEVLPPQLTQSLAQLDIHTLS